MKIWSRKIELICEKVMNRGIYLQTIGIEATILYRFYFSQPDGWSLDLLFQLLVIVFLTPLIFVCLWRASNWDCGRLPREDIDRELDTVNVQTCHKCGALRNDPFVHHCSRCDGCIENMDHHCTFLAQCVGRKNMKYFLQFCIYMFVILFYATCKLLQFFYNDNVRRQ